MTFIFRKTEFMEWKAYKNKIDFLDLFHFQQSVRRSNLKPSSRLYF